MNTQSLDLNKMELAPIQSNEMEELNGGFFLFSAIETLWHVGFDVKYDKPVMA